MNTNFGKKVFTACAAVLLVFSLSTARGDNFPDKPIKLIVPAGAGGGLDREAQSILPYVKKHLSVPVVIEQKPGAGGRVGNDYLFKSPPDGYTIGIVSLPGHIVGELMYKTRYKVSEFTKIYAWAQMNNALFVNADRWTTFDEFVKAARSQRLALGLGAGLGSTPHLTGLLIAEGLNVDFRWVPFKSAAPALAALVGKHVDAVTCVSKSGIPLVEGGKIRPLIVIASKPDPTFPDVPTPKQLGYPIAAQPMLRGIVAPPGVPKDRVKILEDAFREAAKDPEFREAASKKGLVLVDENPEQFSEAIDGIYKDMRTILKRLHAEKKR